MSLTIALQQLEAAHEENARLAKENARLRAEVERLRSGIADLRAGLMRGRIQPSPMDMTPLSGVVAGLDALTRAAGEG